MTASAPLPSQKTAEQQRAHEPSMEEILASIRRIIADDQVLPLTPRPAVQLPKPASNVAPMRPFPREPESESRPEPEPETAASAQPVLRPVPQSRDQEPAQQRRADQPAGPGAPSPEPRRPSFGEPGREDPSLDLRRSLVEEISARAAEEHEPAAEEEPAAAPAPAAAAPQARRRADANRPQPTPRMTQEDEETGPSGLLSVDADASVTSAFQSLASSVMLQNSTFIEQSIRDMLRPMLKQWLDDNLPPLVERLVRAEIERVARGGR